MQVQTTGFSGRVFVPGGGSYGSDMTQEVQT